MTRTIEPLLQPRHQATVKSRTEKPLLIRQNGMILDADRQISSEIPDKGASASRVNVTDEFETDDPVVVQQLVQHGVVTQARTHSGCVGVHNRMAKRAVGSLPEPKSASPKTAEVSKRSTDGWPHRPARSNPISKTHVCHPRAQIAETSRSSPRLAPHPGLPENRTAKRLHPGSSASLS